MTTKRMIDISEDIKRGFVISKGSSTDRFDAYWRWCEANDRIAVEVRLGKKFAVCKIDTFPPQIFKHPFRFSEAQLGELRALCVKHNWRNGSKLGDVFSTINFTNEDALEFAATVATWLKMIKLEN